LNADSAKRNSSVAGKTIARDIEAEESLTKELAAQSGKLSLALRTLAEREDALVVLFVDQLEELHTLGASRDVQESFLSEICAAADDPEDPLRVIFTLRDDFLGRLPGGHALRDALRHVTVLGTPDAENLQEILTRPVTSHGYTYEDPDLVFEMIAAVGGETSALPLLQFTCRRLWEHRDRKAKKLLRAVYDDMGGVGGALAKHADELLDGLSTEHVTLARTLVLRLVTGQKTREVIPRDELLAPLDKDAAFVLDQLINARLLTQRKARDDRRSLIELTHDSLITSWDRLARWIEESREELIFREELDHAAQLWTRRGALDGETWAGRALSDALRTVERLQLDLSPTAQAFLAAGERRSSRRVWQRRGALLLAFAALGLLALLLFFRAQQARNVQSRAEHAKAVAEKRRAEAERRRGLAEIESAWSAYGHGRILQARSQLRDAAERVDTPEVRALWAALKRDPRLWTRDLGSGVHRIRISPNGRWIAAGCMNGAVYLIDTLTQDQRILPGQHDQVRALAFSPDGEILGAATWDGAIQLWNLKTKTQRRFHGHHGAIFSLDFSPDGKHLASGSSDKTVKIWDLASLKAIHTLNTLGARVAAVAYAPDGRALATSTLNGRVSLWNTQTWALLRTVTTYPGGARSAVFSHNGLYLASSGTRGSVKVSPLRPPGPDLVLGGTSVLVLSVAFSADDQTLVSTRSDGAISLWNLKTNSARLIRVKAGAINDVSGNAARRIFATASAAGTIRLWRLRPKRHHNRKPEPLRGVIFSASGQSLFSGTLNRGFYRWNRQGVITHVYAPRGGSRVFGIALSPDGKRIATAGTDYEVRLWDEKSGASRGSLHGHRGLVMDVTFSPDGKLIASASSDRSVRLWDARTKKESFAFPNNTADFWNIAFDATGKRLAAACRDHRIYLFDIDKRKLLRHLVGHSAPVMDVFFKRDGTLLSTSADGTLRSWSIPQGKSNVLLRLPHGRLYFADLSPNEKLIALGASDGIVRLYDIKTRKVSLLRGHRDEANYVRFSPDGKTLASTSDDGTLRTWDVRRRRPLWHAPGILPINAPTHTRWRHAFDASARAVVHGDRAWIATFDHHFETWSVAKDKRIATDDLSEIGPIMDLVAIQGGCLVLGKKSTRRYAESGGFQAIPTASAAFADGDGFLLATSGIVERFDAQGRRVKVLYRGDSNITAIARIRGKLLLGFSTGNIAFADQKEIASQPLAGLPAEAVLRIVSGPANTLVAAFANGLAGIWSITTGRRIAHLYVHGAATYVDVTPDRLRIVSELGDHVEINTRDISRPRCAFLRDVWKHVPTGWRQGRPRLVSPPADHVCAPH
ncbi:MAG: WD40 repeat domain-containing protein, partial [Deltaproteobacteria bacterium]|nr:WD40 repeat domain-containing protein [Deltaproteobacteria bacterium]